MQPILLFISSTSTSIQIIPYRFRNRISNCFQLCYYRWFHGDLTVEEAEARLKHWADSPEDAGAFLVRLSSNRPGCFTISRTVDDQSGLDFKHERVRYVQTTQIPVGGISSPEGVVQDPSRFVPGFMYMKVIYPTLDALVNVCNSHMHYWSERSAPLRACPGSQYKSLFDAFTRRQYQDPEDTTTNPYSED